jgi:hypothetical protein
MAAITALVVVAAAAVYTGVQQRKAAKATARAQRANQRQADIAQARERRAAVRNARVARGSVEAQAANTGLVGGSAAAGSIANIQSRTGENLSFLDQSQALASAASIANEQAAGYTSKAASGQAVGQAAGSFGGIYG